MAFVPDGTGNIMGMVKVNPQIVAALRVKNEGRWIKEVLKSIAWCNAIYLMDDHSEDETAPIAQRCGAVVMPSPFTNFDEARDKEWLTTQISKKHGVGTWVLMIDGDEILDQNGEREIRRTIFLNRRIQAYSLRILYLWDSRDQVRIDGVYGRFRRPSLFVMAGNYGFMRTGFAGNLHCRCIPAMYWKMTSQSAATLLHLGYMEKADRIRKWDFYNNLDPRNTLEGFDPSHPERRSYPWIVQGDVPEVPADARLKHAGPLTVVPLDGH
jgi:glycosyltransferase involved in cell wall biosynthesis